jgi:hypothetical protein
MKAISKDVMIIILSICLLISVVWAEQRECPELDSLYWMPHPIDTLRNDKYFVMVRDANNNYWVWKPNELIQ